MKNPSKRLGSGPRGEDEIKSHRWFKCINWKKLENKEIQPNFRPFVGGNECVLNIADEWTKMSLVDSPATSPRSSEEKENIFEEFGNFV